MPQGSMKRMFLKTKHGGFSGYVPRCLNPGMTACWQSRCICNVGIRKDSVLVRARARQTDRQKDTGIQHSD